MRSTISKLLSSQEFWIDTIVKVLLFGIVVFGFQKCVEHKLKPLTAEETLKRQNFYNAKRDVYYEAIEIINRELAYVEFVDEEGKRTANFTRNRGTKKPTEYEVNTCFSKLCVYSDDSEIPKIYKKIFLPGPEQRPIALVEDFINLLRDDLGYGEGVIVPRTDAYQYISIRAQDSLSN